MATSEFFDVLHHYGVNFKSAIQLTLLTTAVLYCALSIASWYRLRHIKGPWLASISELWIAKSVYSGRFGDVFVDFNRKYGSIARVGPNDLITDDADLIRYINDVRKSGFIRSDFYLASRVDFDQHSVLTTPDVEYHDKLKSQMSAAYGRKGNPGLEQSIDDLLLSVFDLVEQKYISSPSNTKKLDLGKLVQYFTLDVITKLAFGYPWGFLTNEGDIHGFIETFYGLMRPIAVIGATPFLRRIFTIRWVIDAVGLTRNKTTGFGKLRTMCEDIVRERLKDEEQPLDMMGSFIRHGLNQKELESTVFLNMVAGSDTTATAIRATLLHLITNPRVLRRLHQEIDDAINSGRVSRPVIQSSEAKSLPYLQACIREGLRIYPAAAALVSKLSPDHGITYEGTYIPPRTRVGHNIWGVLRNTEVFGDDVDVYRPERWLDESIEGEEIGREEKKMRMSKDVDLVFGFGKWTCLGKTFAEMELNKVFFEIMYRYDITVINPAQAWKCEEFGVIAIHDYWVRVVKREQ